MGGWGLRLLGAHKLKVAVTYPAGHTLESEWEKSDLYCPSCGKQEVWEEKTDGGGDYYCGESHVCVACEASFTLQLFQIKQQSFGGIEIKALRRTIENEAQSVAGRVSGHGTNEGQ